MDHDAAIKVEDREGLIYLLVEAAELEHGVCCTYLFAAFSLKTSEADGLTAEQAQATADWRNTILSVAVQEMAHLALVNNLLTAVGGAPYFGRPNFPLRSKYYPPEIQLSLTPFNERTLERFLYIERPEGMDISALTTEFDVSGPRALPLGDDSILPAPQDFSSIGQLYRGIEQGFRQLAERYGEERLFIGPPEAQATARYFSFPELIPVTDLATAIKAVETIVDEGEGARGDWRDAHFGRFMAIRDAYRAHRRQDSTFAPARPVLENPYVRLPGDVDDANLIGVNVVDDPFTSEVSDLFNGAYEAMLYLLARFFAHTDDTDAELTTLSGAAIDLMDKVVAPLGVLLTTLPAGERFPGMTAGPNFQLMRSVVTLSHKRAAWIIFHERLAELAAYCGRLCAQPAAPQRLNDIQVNLEAIVAQVIQQINAPAAPQAQ